MIQEGYEFNKSHEHVMKWLDLWNEDNPRNWSEDFSHENGNYINTCCFCKLEFIGHKRKIICKRCHDAWENNPNKNL